MNDAREYKDQSEEDATIAFDDLRYVDEKDLERIYADLEAAYTEYDERMREVYKRQRHMISKINQLIDQKKIDSIYNKLKKN